MKKIAIVLLMALALVSIATAEVMVSGEFEYGFMSNADEFAGEFDKIELDFNADIDEYNSFSMELEDDTANNDPGDVALNLNWATVTTDWGMVFDLPVGVSTTIGYDGFGTGDDYYATGLGYENWGGIWLAKEGAVKLEIVPMEMVTAFVAVNVDNEPATTDEYEMMFGAIVEFAPVSLIAAYDTTGEDQVYVEAMFSMEVGEGMNLDVAGSVRLNQDSNAAVGDEMFYGAGVGFGVAGATLGVSMNGNDDVSLSMVGFDVNYGVTEMLDVDLGLGYDMDLSELLGVDVSLAYMAGAVSYRLGYVMSDGYGWDYKAEANTVDGGVYMNVQLDY